MSLPEVEVKIKILVVKNEKQKKTYDVIVQPKIEPQEGEGVLETGPDSDGLTLP